MVAVHYKNVPYMGGKFLLHVNGQAVWPTVVFNTSVGHVGFYNAYSVRMADSSFEASFVIGCCTCVF